ncbi:MAG: glycosyltransferase family 2 protein [Deltaproteobacteria bacterium]|nr:glycosyltransferase family 2 protein [Deltaproteobacteria bacterium]
MVELSIVLNSARDDFPLVGLPDTFLFEPTVKSLNKQELRNFELVIVDALYSEKRRRWLEGHAEFPLKYLNAFPNRWLEHGMVGIATQKNKGLLHAEGELVVFVDDATEFPKDWTKRIHDWFERGHWPMSLTYYYEAGRPKVLGGGEGRVGPFHKSPVKERDVGEFLTFLRPGDVVRDSRTKFLQGETLSAPGSWFYGGSSATLEALLKINGIDERFDGKKGLEDSDTGIRLENAGYAGKFILDRNLYHVENWHRGASEKVLTYRGPTPACKYALLQHNIGDPVANRKILTRADCDWIRDNICPRCNNRARCLNEELGGRFYIESEGFEYWLSNQRVFDLKKERRKIGQSS